MSRESAVRVFVTGAGPGLADIRDALAEHDAVRLVGIAADPALAGGKIAESGAQVVLHGGPSGEAVPHADIEAIRGATAAPIVLAVTGSAGAILADALAAGIFDVLLLPQPIDSVAFTLTRAGSAAATPVSAPVKAGAAEGKVITLFSPKGGAGKTVLACNLAAVFARKHGRRALVLDLDLQFGDAAIMMGLEPDQTLYDLVMARRELDSDALAGYVVSHESGADVLAAPLRPEDAELVTEERLANLFTVAKECYDVIVVDTPPFFHGPVLSALDRTDQLVLVTPLDVPAVKNLKLTLQTLDMLHFPKERRHLLLNRAGSKVGLKAAEVERALDMKVAFQVPSEREVTLSVNRGVPLVVGQPRSSVVKALGEVAEKLAPAPAPVAKKKKARRR